MLLVDIVNAEAGEADTVIEEGFLKDPGGRVGVGFEQKLDAVRGGDRDYCEPTIESHRNVELGLEAENVGVKV